MTLRFASRLDGIETSAIRELFKLLGRPGIISFAGGFPDSAMFDIDGLRAASARALAEDPAGALQYGATEGYRPLREAIARHERGKGVADLRAEDLIVTTGSQQALDLLARTLIDPGDKVVVEAPTFLATIQCFRLYGAELVCAPIDEEGVRVDALESLIVEHRPKLIYLIPSFGNPSGALLPLERRRRVLELAAKHRTLVVEDDPYGELYFSAGASRPSLLALASEVAEARPWLAHCGSLSKVLSPGLRIGWLAGPPELLARATLCKQFSDAHTSTFAQATAAQYLASGRLTPSLARARQVYARRAEVMCHALAQAFGTTLRFARPRGGLFVWTRLSDGTDAARLASHAIRQGVAFVPGNPFHAQEPDPSTFRLSFATSDEASIEEGVSRLAAAFRELKHAQA